ncbi:hypothetical protein L798_13678 [Zootermopsis nevadensis]|uniref:Uncharacterized protein n=1 Tax=Zootermopsis nevadensis TaxID=136037 RepID=A0A067QSH0_ZOONE|nr:hypothetical protein L798_13678 [Zootermopsis nevadensis]
MASLSLPRVLQQRKTSLEQERENFEKCQRTGHFHKRTSRIVTTRLKGHDFHSLGDFWSDLPGNNDVSAQ